MSKLSDAEVDRMLVELRAHFGEPVLPMSRFCSAIETWMMAIEALAQETADDEWRQGYEYHTHLTQIRVDIHKSNLLARLLYGGESLRTQRCPLHKGRWSGTGMGCSHGCGGTGWLPVAPRTEDPGPKRGTIE